MAQEFAHKIPKDIPSDCDQCGYMPKLEDVSVILPEFTGNEISIMCAATIAATNGLISILMYTQLLCIHSSSLYTCGNYYAGY